MRCEECGSSNLQWQRIEGVETLVCGLCGSVAGDDEASARALQALEARAKGHHPDVWPLVKALDRIRGLHVVRSDPGDPEARTWPFVQMVATEPKAAPTALENLVKSLALGAPGHDVHWVVEVEYQTRLLFTLKCRFHRDVDRVGRELLLRARQDLDRVRRNLERDMRLSWWRS